MRDPVLRDRARKNRSQMTWAEAKVWWRLRHRQLGVRFRRQEPIGPYIVDFVCLSRRVIVEIDGMSHAAQASVEKDRRRDAELTSRGFTVLHFTDIDVGRDLDSVIDSIAAAVGAWS